MQFLKCCVSKSDLELGGSKLKLQEGNCFPFKMSNEVHDMHETLFLEEYVVSYFGLLVLRSLQSFSGGPPRSTHFFSSSHHCSSFSSFPWCDRGPHLDLFCYSWGLFKNMSGRKSSGISIVRTRNGAVQQLLACSTADTHDLEHSLNPHPPTWTPPRKRVGPNLLPPLATPPPLLKECDVFIILYHCSTVFVVFHHCPSLSVIFHDFLDNHYVL